LGLKWPHADPTLNPGSVQGQEFKETKTLALIAASHAYITESTAETCKQRLHKNHYPVFQPQIIF
jgi:hypothetical protein